MGDITTAIELSFKIAEAHQALKNLLGDKFDSSNKPYQDALLQRMKDMKLTPLKAAIHMIRESTKAVTEYKDREIAQIQIFAATMEIIKRNKR